MSIDDSTVKHISKLARIQINDKEKKSLKKDLNDILKFIDQLKNVDTKGIVPLQNVNEQELRMREDKVNPDSGVDDLIKNAPENESNFFSVPKVIE
jgi:aspartyl-tRNA(Asn)/glutamyl-tRNA(Gln) amidotransferase subunit C|tara:strand:+ start:247 stop:534 length:288 start_codon:yes stop_codon:yes gene_type:complete